MRKNRRRLREHPRLLSRITHEEGSGPSDRSLFLCSITSPNTPLRSVRYTVGPVTATATIAAIGNGAAFRKGRDFAAWLGVVPEEHSTRGKQTLWKIPRRGNQYLRRLFVQGARAVMQHRTKQSSGLSAWLAQLTARTHQNISIVALANKLARMAWAVLAKNEIYRPPLLAGNTI
jgi:transposase